MAVPEKMLIYWADEVLTAQIPDWQNYVLEHDYFEERNRAWKFYVEAEQCIPTGSPATAELFYLAVVLGFVGDMEAPIAMNSVRNCPGANRIPWKLVANGPLSSATDPESCSSASAGRTTRR